MSTVHEIVCKEEMNAFKLAKILMEEECVVMLSKEEQFTIVNFMWTERPADRNCVVFMSRDEYEEEMFKHIEEEKE